MDPLILIQFTARQILHPWILLHAGSATSRRTSTSRPYSRRPNPSWSGGYGRTHVAAIEARAQGRASDDCRMRRRLGHAPRHTASSVWCATRGCDTGCQRSRSERYRPVARKCESCLLIGWRFQRADLAGHCPSIWGPCTQFALRSASYQQLVDLRFPRLAQGWKFVRSQ